MEVQTARVESDRLNKEIILRDFARFSWRVARGLDEVGEGDMTSLVKRLTEVGRVTSDQANRLILGLQFRIRNSRERFAKRIEATVVNTLSKMGGAAQKEVARLHGRVAELEKRLERIRKV